MCELTGTGVVWLFSLCWEQGMALRLSSFDGDWETEIPECAFELCDLLGELRDYEDDTPIPCMIRCSKADCEKTFAFVCELPRFVDEFERFKGIDVLNAHEAHTHSRILANLYNKYTRKSKGKDDGSVNDELLNWLGASNKLLRVWREYVDIPNTHAIKDVVTLSTKIKSNFYRSIRFYKEMIKKGKTDVLKWALSLPNYSERDFNGRVKGVVETLLSKPGAESFDLFCWVYETFKGEITSRTVVSFFKKACNVNRIDIVQYLYATGYIRDGTLSTVLVDCVSKPDSTPVLDWLDTVSDFRGSKFPFERFVNTFAFACTIERLFDHTREIYRRYMAGRPIRMRTFLVTRALGRYVENYGFYRFHRIDMRVLEWLFSLDTEELVVSPNAWFRALSRTIMLLVDAGERDDKPSESLAKLLYQQLLRRIPECADPGYVEMLFKEMNRDVSFSIVKEWLNKYHS